MKSFTSQYDEMYYAAKTILEGTMADESVIDSVKKMFPSGAKYQKYDNSLYWEKSGGYAGEKSLNTAKEKLEKAGFKYAEAKLVGLPDGSTSGFKTYLLNKKLGWYVTLIQFYGQTSSSNRYSLSLKKVEVTENIEEAFRPGADMVPAPIGPDTVTGKGLKKLWGIKMRAGKWADTFVGLYDLPDGKAYGIIDAEGVTRYASVKDFDAAFKKITL